MPFVSVDDSANLIIPTNSAMIPVLIPRTADPAVTGPNSTWLIAGAGLIGAALFGAKNRKTGAAAKKIKIGK